MTMKVQLDPGAKMPTRAHSNDSGLDLYSKEEKVVPARGSAVFRTGVHVELPYLVVRGVDGFDTLPTTGFIKSKSGMNVKYNITSEGVVDQDYNGEIIVKLYNHGNEDYTVLCGQKITQLVILPVLTPELVLVDKLDDTDRGANGFGSTGR